MNYGSVCSGIEAATAAWHPLGWQPVFFSEIEKFPCQLLAHHYPETPNLGDMTKFKEWPDATLDVLVGGTPCQSFSVAGLRKGLDDPRGNLMLTFGAIASRYRPRWLVWENVPGVLSSNGGQDFASLLGLLTGQHVKPPKEGWSNSGVCQGYKNAYGVAWRILDAEYFGVAQRRNRVFVVGYLGDWRRAAAVLFEPNCLSGNLAPRREKREDVAGTIARCSFTGGAGGRPEGAAANHFIPTGYAPSSFGQYQEGIGTLRKEGGDIGGGSEGLIVCHGTQDPCTNGTTAFALGRNNGGENVVWSATVAQTLNAHFGEKQGLEDQHINGGGGLFVPDTYGVRRLTPTECERLQGFPDGYTKISDKTPDGVRYKALGNSMAVPCMKWLGQRIEFVEELNL